MIHIPGDMLVKRDENPIKTIIDAIYPNFLNKCNNTTYPKEKIVLTAKNETMFEINDYMMSIQTFQVWNTLVWI